MKALLPLIIFATSLFSLENQIPDCYEMSGIEVDYQAPKKELFVIMDQTTIMGTEVQKYVFDSTKKFVKPGYAVNVITFSSNQGNRFTQVAFSGILNFPITKDQRNATSKKQLRKFDQCMKKQYVFASNKIYTAIKSGYKNSSSNIPNSDIFLNLNQVSENAVTRSRAKEKIILISSDMLEHSTISSFYASGTVKNLNPDKEFNKYLNSDLSTDFHGSRIFVVGAGVTNKKRYNDPKKMKNLQRFWKKYFQHNHADLVEFGQPIPLSRVY